MTGVDEIPSIEKQSSNKGIPEHKFDERLPMVGEINEDEDEVEQYNY